jgi:parallel beta-helix repeat protein
MSGLDVSGGQKGILFGLTISSFIRNNFVENTLSTGIEVLSDSSNIDISNNTVNNAGNIGLSPKQSSGGINAGGTAINIINNIISNSGYNGIIFAGYMFNVQNNVVDRSCLVLDDCAGIYTYLTNTSSNNSIVGNTVTNALGNFSGTAYSNYSLTQAQGIYLDDGDHDTIVSNNIISNADYGIFIHAGYNNTITGNTVYGARMYALLINEDGVAAKAAGGVHDNIVTGNTFETISTEATAYYYSTIETTTNFGTYDNNQYYHPKSNYVVKNQNVNYTLPTWQQASGQDLHSTDSKSYAPRTGTLTPPNLSIK